MGISIFGDMYEFSPYQALMGSVNELERPSQRRHELWIPTCYVDLACVKDLVKALDEEVRLTDVYLAFNFAEIYKDGPGFTYETIKKIKAWCERRGVNFEYAALSSSRLVHAKGYALVQRSSGEVSGGFCLVSSANFTRPGFWGGNIEIGYSSKKKKDISQFAEHYDRIWNDLKKDIDEKVFLEQDHQLRFSLLSSGVFLHKWSGSVGSLTGIKYTLTDLAKGMGSVAPELAALGFETGQTFTRQVFNLRSLPKKEVPPSFTRYYTIDTSWGRWCPRAVWEAMCRHMSGADTFIEDFQRATTDDELELLVTEARKVEALLVDKRLIVPVGNDHTERWKARMVELRENSSRLDRLFTGYVANPQPFEYERESDIGDVFESLMESIQLSGSKNKVKKAFLDAWEGRCLDPLEAVQVDYSFAADTEVVD